MLLTGDSDSYEIIHSTPSGMNSTIIFLNIARKHTNYRTTDKVAEVGQEI